MLPKTAVYIVSTKLLNLFKQTNNHVMLHSINGMGHLSNQHHFFGFIVFTSRDSVEVNSA